MAKPDQKTEISSRIFCAVDTSDLSEALNIVSQLDKLVGGFKLGKEFFTAFGPKGVTKIAERGVKVFLDLKFHDIPNTVARAVKAAVRLKPYILNVHALGGIAMMKAAYDAACEESEREGFERPVVVGVTILTSLDTQDIRNIGFKHPTAAEAVVNLASEVKKAGLDGVVCSGQEIECLKSRFGIDFKLVVPGLRPPYPTHDQKRLMSPREAFKKGADFLIIGRPITQLVNPKTGRRVPPAEAVDLIVRDIAGEDVFDLKVSA